MADSLSDNPDYTVVQTGTPTVLRDTILPEIPGYSVACEIARGGMGAVYAARDLVLNREVALKVLRPDATSAEAVLRFVREAEITARLPHPGIPPVHQLGTLPDGKPFLAMKLVRGRTLATTLANRVGVGVGAELLHTFEQIAQAVGFAHSQGVIHRDLKPANVMVGAFGEVQVMDWGLARELKEERADGAGAAPDLPNPAPSSALSTQVGRVMGTPAYMAPEQARGEVVDVRADVFALGGILCAILTGQAPFGGTTVNDTVKQAAAGNVTDALVRLGACDADADLIALAKRCLSPEVGHRPTDGKAVADEVAAYRVGVEVRLFQAQTARAAAEAKATEQRKRRRVQLALAAVIGLLALGAVAFAWREDKQANEREAESQRIANEKQTEAQQQRFEDENRKQLEAARRERNGESVALLLDKCESALRSNDAPAATILLRLAEKQMDEGGADRLKSRLADCRTDLETLVKLDAVIDALWIPDSSGKLHIDQVVKRLDEVLEGFGISLGTTPTETAVQKVRTSSIRERLLAALDLRLTWHTSDDLLAILRATDPDPFRDAVRAAYRAKDSKEVAALTARREVLEQPLRFVTVLNGLSPESRTQITLTIQLRRVDEPTAEAHLVFFYLTSAHQYNIQDPGTVPDRLRLYQTVLALRPNSAVAWSGVGVALGQLKAWTGAEAALRKAIQLSPRTAYFREYLANILGGQGKWTEAVPLYHQALELEPKHPGFTKNLATAHYQIGRQLSARRDWTGAISHFKEVVRLDPDADAHNRLAVAYAEIDAFDDALEHTARAMQFEKDPAKQAVHQKNVAILRQLKAAREAKVAPAPREVQRP